MQLAVLSKAEATVSFCCRYGECLGCCQEREATLRADLARVTAERDAIVEKLCAEDRDFSTLRDDLERAQFNENANWHQAESYRSRLDAARAQVRELQKVARAAVYVVECGKRHDVAAVAESVGIMRVHVDALPPSMLEEPSDG